MFVLYNIHLLCVPESWYLFRIGLLIVYINDKTINSVTFNRLQCTSAILVLYD
jgi:hypothetical protein